MERSKLDIHSRNPESCLKLQKIRSSTFVCDKAKTQTTMLISKSVKRAREQGHEQDPKHQAKVAIEESVEPNAVPIANDNKRENTHICNICNKQYKNRYDLIQHNNVHTGKFSCPRCNASFRRRRELEKHSRRAVNCTKLQIIRSSAFLHVNDTNDNSNVSESEPNFANQNPASSQQETVDFKGLQCPEQVPKDQTLETLQQTFSGITFRPNNRFHS